MKKHQIKTNAVRITEKHGISYELREYEVDENDLSGMNVAEKIGMSPEQVFKTLVVHGDKTGHFMACIPTDSELDLKELAKISGNKKVELIPVKDINSLTGYIRGGVSPIGAKKPFKVYLDESAFKCQSISVSAGVRGCQMIINPKDLSKVVEIVPAVISNKKSG
jgi:Cys-tRNA(Pro)/Cys-tRNA(Cys) deacylase